MACPATHLHGTLSSITSPRNRRQPSPLYFSHVKNSYQHQNCSTFQRKYSTMPSVLIVGATRGLGASLTKKYAAREGSTVYGTTRSDKAPDGFPNSVKWLPGVDLTDSGAADHLVKLLGDSQPLSTVVSYPSSRPRDLCLRRTLHVRLSRLATSQPKI